MSKIKKIPLHMNLPQSAGLIGDDEKLYNLFYERIMEKSSDKYRDKSHNPTVAIFNFNNAGDDETSAGKVVVGSCKKTIVEGVEIGFTAKVKFPSNYEKSLLTVLKAGNPEDSKAKRAKAYFESLKDVKNLLKKIKAKKKKKENQNKKE